MKRLVTALSAAVRRAPVVVLVAVLVVSAVMGVLSTQVQQATGNEGYSPDTPELQAQETISEEFGSSGDTVMQVLVRGEDDVIGAAGVQVMAGLQQALLQGPEAELLVQREDQPPIVTYLSPVFEAAQAQGLDPLALDDAAVESLYRQALQFAPPEQADFITALLPDDADPQDAEADLGMAVLFLDTAAVGDDFEALADAQQRLAQAVSAVDTPAGITLEPFAFGLLFAETEGFTQEVARLFTLAALIIVVILGFVFFVRPHGIGLVRGLRRTAVDVALTMLVIGLAILWTNGFAALLGPGYLGWLGPAAEPTRILPVLLIGLGVDYAIHLSSRYREEVGEGRSIEAGIERATRTVGVALVLATVTTAVGFFTNIFTPVPAVRDFGILAGLGIGAAFLLMLTVFPAVRLLLDRRAEAAGRVPREALAATGERLLPNMMARLAVFAERVPVATLVVTVGIGGTLGVIGMLNLTTEFSFTDFMPEDAPIVETLDTIQEEFGGGFGESTNVLVSGDVAAVGVWNELVAAQAELAEVQDVTRFGGQAAATSPVTVLGELLQGAEATQPPPLPPEVLGGLQPDLTLAEGTDVAALYDGLLEAAPDQAGQVLARGEDGGYDHLRVIVQTEAGEARAGALAESLSEVFEPVAEAADGTAVPTSDRIISDAVTTSLSNSQFVSLFVAVAAAMVLLIGNFWVTARRPWLGFVTIAPVALVVLWTFGLMAVTGIPIGPVTATIAALAVGIGVPYTIHVAHRFTEDRERHADVADAIRSTVRHTGGALAGSAFTTMAGFGILVTSSLTPFQQFGLVTVYAIGFALVAATVVLPSMLVLWDRYRRRRGDLPEVLRAAGRDSAPAPADSGRRPEPTAP